MRRDVTFCFRLLGVLLAALGLGSARADVTYKIVQSDTGAIGGTLKFADLNGDGKMDIVVFSGDNILLIRTSTSFDVWFGNGDGTFQHSKKYTLSGGYVALEIADFNGDGKPDIAAAWGDYRGGLVLTAT